ncbi:hypothetical protein BGZ46_010617 [Entomortierella lignicola]|nr:hypothetical protein BGZ46_010617 [Entomortierella lignicola]
MRVRASDLPNPFLEPKQEASSPIIKPQRGPFKSKGRGNSKTTALDSTSSSTTPATPNKSDTTSALTETPGTTSIPTGVTPKRQYKKTILRQQAALLAAQIKDENEVRDLEATRRVFARTSVVERLRSLRSRLTYAHYKVDQGLEEQPLHIVTELFEESLGEGGESDDHPYSKSSRRLHPTTLVPKDTTTHLSVKERADTSNPDNLSTSYSTRLPHSESSDNEHGSTTDGHVDYHDPIEEYSLSSLYKTPTKNNQGRQINVYSDEDSGSDSDLDTFGSPDALSSLTHEELLMQQQQQLEELQRKQLEQLQKLQKFQREQQLSLQKAHAQHSRRQKSTLESESTPLSSKSQRKTRIVREHSDVDKDPSRSRSSIEKDHLQKITLSSLQTQSRHQHLPSPTKDLQFVRKSSLKSQSSGANVAQSDVSPPSSPAPSSVEAVQSSSKAVTESQERRSQMNRRSLDQLQLLADDSNSAVSQSNANSSISKKQQQQEYRQRQEQKLEQNRQKEQELLRRQRLLEQQQQQQQKRKQLLLQLQQHQLQELPLSRSQDTSFRQQTPLSSTPSRQKSSSIMAMTQSTPKKKKPLNPVQKAPSTENILASVRSTPTSMRSALIATSPALTAAKNKLLGNKRGHSTFEDKENLPLTQSSPLRKEALINQRTVLSTRDHTPSPSKGNKRQKPASQKAHSSISNISTTPFIESPTVAQKADPISMTITDSAKAQLPLLTLMNPVPTAPEVTPVALPTSSPVSAPLIQTDTPVAFQTSKEFLDCFEQWMSDPASGKIDTFPLDPTLQSDPLPSTPFSDPNEIQTLTHYKQPTVDSDLDDETELDDNEIDRLLYSEVGEVYRSYGDQGCVSTPSSELGHHELPSDTGTADLYDWFSDATQDLQLYGTNEQHLSILSMDPTLSSSPAELAESLELGLDYDPAGDLLWLQQEQQLQQQLQLHQPHIVRGEIREQRSSRSGTPLLDSTTSTILSSFSEISPDPIPTRNHSNHYIPMGLDGGVISNAEEGNDDQEDAEQHIHNKDSFIARNDGNLEYIFGV